LTHDYPQKEPKESGGGKKILGGRDPFIKMKALLKRGEVQCERKERRGGGKSPSNNLEWPKGGHGCGEKQERFLRAGGSRSTMFGGAETIAKREKRDLVEVRRISCR